LLTARFQINIFSYSILSLKLNFAKEPESVPFNITQIKYLIVSKFGDAKSMEMKEIKF
jgi:hypothetical protein